MSASTQRGFSSSARFASCCARSGVGGVHRLVGQVLRRELRVFLSAENRLHRLFHHERRREDDRQTGCRERLSSRAFFLFWLNTPFLAIGHDGLLSAPRRLYTVGNSIRPR
jgi:hypothetical protein